MSINRFSIDFVLCKNLYKDCGKILFIATDYKYRALQVSTKKTWTIIWKVYLEQVVPVAGNICETNIGIQEDVAHSIAREVDIIIHSASSTEFDGRYSDLIYLTFSNYNLYFFV